VPRFPHVPESESHTARVQAEFRRTADAFTRRTQGRFDALGVVEFSRVRPGAIVAEVGAGTGSFLSLFEDVAARLIAVDLTHAMLDMARSRHPKIEPVAADGSALPLARSSVDLVSSAQMLHHVWTPLDIVKEMARVVTDDGHVLIVDQAAPESYEQAEAMNVLEVIRDPSHAASRPPSAFRILVRAAGLEILDEKIVEFAQRFSKWMGPDEFPPERIEAARDFIAKRGHETGMNFERDGDEWVYTRTRIMLLADHARGRGD
jgi:ubiquinone/menaquinone biosynthesis C-methylase UbiE